MAHKRIVKGVQYSIPRCCGLRISREHPHVSAKENLDGILSFRPSACTVTCGSATTIAISTVPLSPGTRQTEQGASSAGTPGYAKGCKPRGPCHPVNRLMNRYRRDSARLRSPQIEDCGNNITHRGEREEERQSGRGGWEWWRGGRLSLTSTNSNLQCQGELDKDYVFNSIHVLSFCVGSSPTFPSIDNFSVPSCSASPPSPPPASSRPPWVRLQLAPPSPPQGPQ